jgi:hypothetical protein
MIVVDISNLDGELKEEVSEFVESKLAVKPERDGDKISFEDKSERTHVTGPEVRTYLKRFIHSKDIKKKYRILKEEESFKFVKLVQEQVKEEE